MGGGLQGRVTSWHVGGPYLFQNSEIMKKEGTKGAEGGKSISKLGKKKAFGGGSIKKETSKSKGGTERKRDVGRLDLALKPGNSGGKVRGIRRKKNERRITLRKRKLRRGLSGASSQTS